jgi:hypothetical protein
MLIPALLCAAAGVPLCAGTGKTLLARAVANRTDACFIRVIGSELVQKYVGEVREGRGIRTCQLQHRCGITSVLQQGSSSAAAAGEASSCPFVVKSFMWATHNSSCNVAIAA